MCEKIEQGEIKGIGQGGSKEIPLPEVAMARCTGCGRCVAACRERLLTLEVTGYRKHAFLREPARCTRCLDCLDCVAACPVGALSCRISGDDAGR